MKRYQPSNNPVLIRSRKIQNKQSLISYLQGYTTRSLVVQPRAATSSLSRGKRRSSRQARNISLLAATFRYTRYHFFFCFVLPAHTPYLSRINERARAVELWRRPSSLSRNTVHAGACSAPGVKLVRKNPYTRRGEDALDYYPDYTSVRVEKRRGS